jgi:uracil-DNA glycosylase
MLDNIFSSLNNSWKNILSDELKKEYIHNLNTFLQKEYKQYTIYPYKENLFTAFNLTQFDDIRVVIIAQDPYHNKNQANGLAFSVNNNIAIPKSLINIYKELKNDLGIKPPINGNLDKWAKQGVFLINTVLSVREKEPNSYKNKGWEIFTNNIIQTISNKKENIVFILWGKNAQEKANIINAKKHYIISSPHPSPLSAYRGFFGSKPFSKINNFLSSKKIKTINWAIV